jgi:hypothetical protein
MRKALLRSGSMHRRMKELVDRAASRSNRLPSLELALPLALHGCEQDGPAATGWGGDAAGAFAAEAARGEQQQLPGALRRTSSSALASATVSSGTLAAQSGSTLASGGASRRCVQQRVVGERSTGAIVGDLNFEGLVKASEVTVIAKSPVTVLAIKKADIQDVPAKMLIKAVIERHRTESMATEAVEKLAAWEQDMAEMDEWRSQANASPGGLLQAAEGERLAAAGDDAHSGVWAL